MSEDNEPEQIKLTKRLVELAVERTQMSAERTKMAAERSEFSAERSYMNAERTLSVWVRTALALMIFGIAIDRFGLLLRRLPASSTNAHLYPNELSNWSGLALVVLGVLMVLATGARFLAYAAAYKHQHRLPVHHGPFLAPFFALMVAVFGVGLLVIMFVFARP